MNKLLFTGALLGLLSVTIGAMADHAFDLDEASLVSVQTAIRYNMLYAAIITILSLLRVDKMVVMAGYIFAAGTLLFAGGIYGAYIGGVSAMVYLTPAGGITLMIGWLFLAVFSLRKRA